MKEYKFEDIKVGMKESFDKEITREMEDAFRMISGDENPLHLDDNYAKDVFQGKYDKHVTFGMLTASLYSTIAGMYLPGKYSLIHSFDELAFMQPVFIGDVLTVEGEVTEVDEALKIIRIKVIIKNQLGKKISRAKMKIMVMR